ncbi:L-glutamate gamma-semialdehyde dehydrogenase [Coprothermobacter platensis]|uniref:L-glutamate gamma-semialdehyde dehydrogenase n=1 Tax=Coprothermobacter platensis TaxID=108819 RepID=UPI000381BD20|nr:L-glutamate gamma-semialdehyde dehydrogenase [Coprothermobacter platensis]
MSDAGFHIPVPKNEEVLSYAPGTPERKQVKAELERQSNTTIEIPLIIGGKEVYTGRTGKIVMPHDHGHVLATYHKAGPEETKMAIDAALKAKNDWANMPWVDRASIFLKAAELLSKKYRHLINAATMLGQGKNVYQAEIDAACESIDYLRYNPYFASLINQWEPVSVGDSFNRMEYRPLEGFVFAVSPFNFTAIAMNLATAPALMGNVIVWKPASTAVLSNYYVMKLLQEAGVPDGVINFLPGSGPDISDTVFSHPYFAGLHFTGSTATFDSFWQTVAQHMGSYKTYPRLVGETGGKDFVIAHPSADADALITALIRGAFEYQGQKCSAASRAYIAKSVWDKIKAKLVEQTESILMGDVRDFRNFVNAVIDEPSFDKIMGYIEKAKNSNVAQIIAGGQGDKSKGYFVRPTIIETQDPHFVTMQEEIFGPVLTVYVYEDSDYENVLQLCNETSPYGLTGSIFANDRMAVEQAYETLRFAAGNFYINDKPTGAVVGQQPFGGARRSGTNDKAGSPFNLMRWISPRTIKENLIPPTNWTYPFLQEE